MISLLNITLRRAKITDIAAIMQLYKQTVLTICKADYQNNELKAWAGLGQQPESWEKRMQQQYFLVAELPQQIAGFASLSDDGYLDVCYVHKDYQHMGVATMLYKALEDYATKIALPTLKADVSKTARAFFEKQGFSMITVQQNHIAELVIINYRMEKKL